MKIKPARKQPRGRPAKTGRSEDILDAALDEFSTKGFDAARLEDVAKKAGISKGTIYLYFDSKERLFEGVVRRWILPTVAEAEDMLAHHDGPVEDLIRAQVHRIYRELAGSRLRQILRLMIAEGPRFPHLVDFYFDTVIQRGLKTLKQTIELGVERGEFRATALPDYPLTVLGPAVTAAVWKILFDTHHPLDLEALFETHFDILMDGLRKI
ncbi:MAG: TetR/AcrR family transcriptional regulator [Pseudomonadota bacterium]